MRIVFKDLKHGEIKLMPEKGHVGDEIQITGEGLKDDQNINIKYENDKLYVDYINDSELYHYDQDIFETYQLYKYYRFNFIKDQKENIISLNRSK